MIMMNQLLKFIDKKDGRDKMNQDILKRAGEIVEKNTGPGTYCVLAQIDMDDYPTVSTITASKAEGINWITFCTGLGANKTNRINKCNRASVCFNAEDYNITFLLTVFCASKQNVIVYWWIGRKLEENYNEVRMGK